MTEQKVYVPKIYSDSELSGKSGIYQIRNLQNNKLYIGSTIDLLRRKREHINKLKNKIHTNEHLQNAYNLDGKNNFIFEVIEFVENDDELLECEQYWMDRFNVVDKGYNIRPRADRKLIAEESRLKLKILAKERYKNEKNFWYGKKLSEEIKRKISTTRIIRGVAKGVKNPFYGKHWSEEEKRNQSNKLKEYYKNKEKHPMYNKHHSESTKQKMRKNHANVIGKNNPMFGIHRYGLEASNKRKVVRLLDNKVYDLIEFCAKDNNISTSTITNHCNNRLKTKKPEYMYFEDWLKVNTN